MAKCENQSKNNSRCNCTYPGCSHHGICCECIAYHRNLGELPACYFTEKEEKTYNRTISYFVQNRK